MRLGVRRSWKSLRDPKTVCNSPRNWPESAKSTSIYDRHVSAPGVRQSWNEGQEPKIVSNSPRNGLESAKAARVEKRDVKGTRVDLVGDIILETKNSK